jgi:hypothetical protein
VNVANSAFEHNRRLHSSEQAILAELQKGKTPEEQRRIELAAKYLVKASSGVSVNDKEYSPLSQDEIEGSKYVKEQGMLVEAAQQRKTKLAWSKTMEEMRLAEGLPGDPSKYTQRTFDYTTQDQLSDFISRREEGLYRTGQLGQAIIGAAGTVGMGAGALGLEGYSLGLGTVGATALAGGAYTSYEHTKTSIENITGPYQLQEGLKTQQSFKTPTTGSYITEKGGDVVMSAAVGVGSAKLAATGLQALQKAMPKVKSVLYKNQNSAISIKPTVSTQLASDKGNNGPPVVKWVDENASMSETARKYNDSASGARSNAVTKYGQAPAIQLTTDKNKIKFVRFDGVENNILIDRKLSVVTTEKSKSQALRQSEALKQNGLKGRWEVPNKAQALRARKMFDSLDIKNIDIKIINDNGIR